MAVVAVHARRPEQISEEATLSIALEIAETVQEIAAISKMIAEQSHDHTVIERRNELQERIESLLLSFCSLQPCASKERAADEV